MITIPEEPQQADDITTSNSLILIKDGSDSSCTI
jgi:hypothetical protein